MIRQATEFVLAHGLAVWLILLVLLLLSVTRIRQIPLALLPVEEAPVIRVVFRYPGHEVQTVELVMSDILPELKQINELRDLRYDLTDDRGEVRLFFAPGSDMETHYSAVAERLDQLNHMLPDYMERPVIIPPNQNMLPVVKILCIPDSLTLRYSDYVLNTVAPRIQQLSGVSMVDISGTIEPHMVLTTDREVLRILGRTQEEVRKSILNFQGKPQQLLFREGAVTKRLMVGQEKPGINRLPELVLTSTDRRSVRLKEVASIRTGQKREAAHSYNGREVVALRIYARTNADILKLNATLGNLLGELHDQEKGIHFVLRENQAVLLERNLGTLLLSIIVALLAASFTVMLFLGSIRLSLIMVISLPLTLILCSGLFAISGISINIISLSGIAFGVGLMIDNAIIVVENIHCKKLLGHSVTVSCAEGTAEIFLPLTGSVVSTLLVYIPLLWTEGNTRVLLRDQAFGMTVVLLASFILSMTVLPLFYRQIAATYRIKGEGIIFRYMHTGYIRIYRFCCRNHGTVLTLMVMVIASAIRLSWSMVPEGMPSTHPQYGELALQDFPPAGFDSLLTACKDVERIEGRPAYWLGEHRESAVTYIGNYSMLDSMTTSPDRALMADRNTLQPIPDMYTRLFETDRPAIQLLIHSRNESRIFYPTDQFVVDTLIYVKPEFSRQLHLNIPASNTMPEEAITQVTDRGRDMPLILASTGRTITVQKKDRRYLQSDYTFSTLRRRLKNITGNENGKFLTLNFENIDQAMHVRDSLLRRQGRSIASIDVGGRLPEIHRNWQLLAYGGGLAFVLLYIGLVVQFNSLRYPVLVLMHIPVSLAGGLIFASFGEGLNQMSGIGLIIMLGIVVNDAILKVSTMRTLQQNGMPTAEALERAGEMRLKAIVMTTVTTVAGCLPLFIFDSLGTELQRSQALSLIGGILFATGSVLFLTPTLYAIAARLKII